MYMVLALAKVSTMTGRWGLISSCASSSYVAKAEHAASWTCLLRSNMPLKSSCISMWNPCEHRYHSSGRAPSAVAEAPLLGHANPTMLVNYKYVLPQYLRLTMHTLLQTATLPDFPHTLVCACVCVCAHVSGYVGAETTHHLPILCNNSFPLRKELICKVEIKITNRNLCVRKRSTAGRIP